MQCDTIWTDARLVTMTGDGPGASDGIGIITDGMIAARDGRILYAGPAADAPAFEPRETVRCDGRWITPGLIDCHTHLVYAGNRADEFQQRLAGASYEEIARAGGGIASTMKATRAASEDELVALALPRLDALLGEGVTAIEIKSGYGLDTSSELAMLRAARRLGRERGVTVSTSFLGAHALPPEFAGDADGYIDLLCRETLPLAAGEGLVDTVDIYTETIGFTLEQTRRMFDAASALGLPVRIHAEQFSDMGGSALAASYGALSSDHLEYLSADGIAAMAQSGTVATLLPGAYYFTRETKLPPVQPLRDAGVPIALATDCNPGSSPMTSLLLGMNMGATLFRLTVEECLRGTTINAARALGMAADAGSLEQGKRADLAIWNIETPAELVYRIGFNPIHQRVFAGQ